MARAAVMVAANARACDWPANDGSIDEVSNIAANIPLASKIGAPAQLSPTWRERKCWSR